MFNIKFFIIFINFHLIFASPYHSRSRTKSSSPTYDQKQTGDYNIQLHLKDFQVVALLSEGALGELGEYDYSYDYSELTVKPSTSTQKPSSTTQKEQSTPTPVSTTTVFIPTTTQAPPSTTQKLVSTNHVPPNSPPLIHHSTTTVTASSTGSSNGITSSTTGSSTTSPPKVTSKPEKVTTRPETTIKPMITTTTEKRIHVEVIQVPKDPKLEDTMPVKDENKIDGTKLEVSNTGMPNKQTNEVGPMNNKEEINQTEPIMAASSYRKCATGYQRDKNGRCRRVRRPVSQFPFGISRLATLASKLRQASTDGQTPNIE